MRPPKFRCGTKKAVDELAIELGLPNGHEMQDWSYQVANPDDIDRYFQHYETTIDEDKKFVLMELLIQAVNEQTDERHYNYWGTKLESILSKDFKLHEYTVFYWACFDNFDTNDIWRIAPMMRKIWTSKGDEETTR